MRAYLGPDYDVDKHFTPRYKPWDQRLCLVPDGDFFLAIRKNKASVVTDQIESFHRNRPELKLTRAPNCAADLVVTATGLDLKVLGGVQLTVDGAAIDLSQTLTYKGLMFSGVPNLASSFGYTNASWTLKCDLTCEYVCRLLNHMDKRGLRQCTPTLTDPSMPLSRGRIFFRLLPARAAPVAEAGVAPWKLHQNYARDLMPLRYGKLDDGAMVFGNPAQSECP